jgi:beta-aspartyl-peptidase (threonine type)
LLALAPLPAGAGCARGPQCAAAQVRQPAFTEIHNILQDQAEHWNRGEVESFMDAYWRSPELTFSSGGTVVRGWEETLDRYRRRYPDRRAMGQVSFTDLEFVELGPDAALVLGRWRLERGDPVGGAFTLVWRKIDGRWVIVHDHTSIDDGP